DAPGGDAQARHAARPPSASRSPDSARSRGRGRARSSAVPVADDAMQQQLDQRVALGEQVQRLLAQPAPHDRVDHARQRDGQPARRPAYKQPVAGAAPENALEEAEVLLVLIVDALPEAPAPVELIPRPPPEAE